MKYTNIKKLLNTQIKKGVKALWTWKDNNFTMIYKDYGPSDRIYTPTQLIEEIDNQIKKEENEENE
jgi:hypothetical protein